MRQRDLSFALVRFLCSVLGSFALVGLMLGAEAPASGDQTPQKQTYTYKQVGNQNGLWPREVIGLDPDTEPAALQPYCPLQNVSKDYPPTLLLHGDKDTDVPFEQSVLMDQALQREGVPHQFIKIPGAGHRFDRDMNAPETIRAFDQVLSFLKEHLR